MLKKTDELNFELENTQCVHSYITANDSEFDDKVFCNFFNSLIDRCGKSKTKIAADACISEPYLYEIIRGVKRPTRNIVIKLAFALGSSLETTERLMMLAGHSSFYVRHKRDSLLKYAFQNGLSISEADSLLVEYGFSVMTE